MHTQRACRGKLGRLFSAIMDGWEQSGNDDNRCRDCKGRLPQSLINAARLQKQNYFQKTVIFVYRKYVSQSFYKFASSFIFADGCLFATAMASAKK